MVYGSLADRAREGFCSGILIKFWVVTGVLMDAETKIDQSQQDERWMRHALKLASQAEALDEVPVGAVVVNDNVVVGEGFNRPISGNDPTAHAEIVALRDAAQRLGNYRLVDCTLYVTVEPCTMCVGALIHARIKRLVFGTTEPKAGAIVSAVRTLDHDFYNHRIDTDQGVLAGECRTIISDFFSRKRAAGK
jgi:tRNA(adenine34) deaminase